MPTRRLAPLVLMLAALVCVACKSPTPKPPVPVSRTVARVGQHSATLGWVASTTAGVTSYNVKRGTTSGGPYVTVGSVSGTAFNDNTVTAGTYYYVVSAVAAGVESPNSTEVSGTVPGTPPPPPVCSTIPVNSWTNTAITSQTGTFSVDYDATPASATNDTIIGLGPVAATTFTSIGPIVWFSNVGTIQARNAGAYAAANSYKYAANVSVHVRMAINIPAHTYSAWVHTGTAAETQIALNYAFRTEQATATSLAFFSEYVNVGTATIQVCNLSLTGVAPPPPVTITIAPTSKTLVASTTQQFTATVTNATNTAVTWTATSGSVSASGLFTAGTVAGTGSVTATSMADPTKSASASVTITAPAASITMTCTSLVCTIVPTNVTSGTKLQVTATGTGLAASATATAP